MKYSEMVKFLNDNGICVMQPVIANELDAQLPFSIPEEDFEKICANVCETYLECFDEPDIWELVADELKVYYQNRIHYLKDKERVCPLDKEELYELMELEKM